MQEIAASVLDLIIYFVVLEAFDYEYFDQTSDHDQAGIVPTISTFHSSWTCGR
jgi:hypothetical protein